MEGEKLRKCCLPFQGCYYSTAPEGRATATSGYYQEGCTLAAGTPQLTFLPKRTYREYTEEQAAKAFEALRQGWPVRRVAETYGIPRRTVCHWRQKEMTRLQQQKATGLMMMSSANDSTDAMSSVATSSGSIHHNRQTSVDQQQCFSEGVSHIDLKDQQTENMDNR